MLQLAAGDFNIADDQPQRATEIADMAQATEIFRRNLIDRQRLNHETGLLVCLTSGSNPRARSMNSTTW